MARKGVLETLMSLPQETPDDAQKAPVVPKTRALNRMDQSLQQLQQSAVQEIPLDRIDHFRFHDRIDIEEDLDPLVESLAGHGQEVPIKVRPIEGTNRYQVIIGRRRCAAARRLGWDTIKGMVQEKNDMEALASMISENSARRETSYIGRALLFAKAIESGMKQIELVEATGCSKGHISHLLRTYNLVGEELIKAIGDAVGDGRTRWDPVGVAMQELGLSSAEAAELVDTSTKSSNKRLADLHKLLKQKLREASPTPSGEPKSKTVNKDLWDGRCQLKRSGDAVTIKRLKDAPEDMLDFIEQRLPDLIKEYQTLKESG
jgi:ParB family chromosome partitioning protein